ncbi:hypothetical protein DL96DRAFT_1625100, partial [Flagelloscypha sp. PMI_526]
MQVFQPWVRFTSPKRPARGPPQVLIPVEPIKVSPSYEVLGKILDSLNLDIQRLICEIAAFHDQKTASNLSLSCRTMYSWITPIRFRFMHIRTPEQAYRLRLLERLDHFHIADAVHELLFDELAWHPTDLAVVIIPFNLQLILSYFPNLTTLACSNTWSIQAPLSSLPPRVHTLHILDVHPRSERLPLISDAVSRAQITHLYILPHYTLDDFHNLTHLWVSTRYEHPKNDCWRGGPFVSYLLGLPPVKTFPTSVKTCILYSQKTIYFNSPSPLHLVELIMGDIDSRIVLAVAEPRRSWDYTGLKAQFLLQDAVIFWEMSRIPNDDVWGEARKVMTRRIDPDFKEKVRQLNQSPRCRC